MKQSIFRRTLLLFLCAALLMSLFGAAFAAENAQTQFFYFSASKESGVIVPPEKLYYTDPEATVRQVLLASGHIFKGLEQGWVEQIDGVDGNFNRSDENGGYDLDARASSVRYFCFYEGEQFMTPARLSLIGVMADYLEKPQDVQKAAKSAYDAACADFAATDETQLQALADALTGAIAAYEQAQGGEGFRVTFTDGAERYSAANRPGIAITAENAYGKTFTDEDGDGVLTLVAGEYAFHVVQAHNRIDGTISVSGEQTVSAELPSGEWMAAGARVSLASGKDAFEQAELAVTAEDHTLRACVPDTYAAGSVYLYADYDHSVFSDTPKLNAYYTRTDGTVIDPQNAPALSSRAWNSFVSPVTGVLAAGAGGACVAYRVGAQDANGYMRSQEYTLVLERSLSLSGLRVCDENGRVQGAAELFSPDTRQYNYQVLSGVSSVEITPVTFGDYTVRVNGEPMTGSSAVVALSEDETLVELTLSCAGARESAYTLRFSKADGKNAIFGISQENVTLAVYNLNGEEISPLSAENPHTYKLIPGETYTYIASIGDYHTSGSFQKTAAVQRIAVHVDTADWIGGVKLSEKRGMSTLYTFEEGAFSSDRHSYTLLVSDRSSSMYAQASLIDEAALEALGLTAADITLTAVYHRISQSPSQNGKKNTVPVSKASILQSLLMSNALGNTLTFRASRTQGGVTYYQDYTVTIRRTLSLDALRVSYAGAAMKMTPDYAASVTQYAVTAPMGARALTVQPVLRKTVVMPYGAGENGYAVEVAGAEPDGNGGYLAALNGTNEAETVTIRVKNTNSPDAVTEILLRVEKVPPVAFTPELTPSDALLVLVDRGTGTRIWPDANGTWSISKDFTYDYDLTARGCAGKTGWLRAADNENGETVLTFSDGTSAAVVTGADGALRAAASMQLPRAAENTALDRTLEAEWADFRGTSYTYDSTQGKLVAGGTNYTNNGVVASPMPISAADSMLSWATQLGEGYSGNAVGCPILVDGSLITYAASTLYRVDAVSGEVLAQGTMAGGSSFAINPPTYYEGMIFVGLSNGRIQAFDAKTLESLWLYTDAIGGQPNCPIVVYDGYLYTGFWQGETLDANFVCLSVTDEDPSSRLEQKIPTWTHTQTGGFYWAGAYVCDDFLLIGTDDGQSGYASESGVHKTAELLMLDRRTGRIMDRREGICADQRSSICYDAETDAYYFTTKGGYFYRARAAQENGAWRISELRELKLDNYADQLTNPAMSTCTPVVYNHRAYIGISGTGQFKAYSGHNLTVIDLDKWKIAYKVRTQGYPQTSGLLTTAYADTGYVYVYFFDNFTPGKLRVLRDRPGQTSAEFVTKESFVVGGKTETYDTPYALFTPAGDEAQYAICSPIADEYGTIYFKNDSARLMAFGASIRSVNVEKMPDKLSYAEGEPFDPAGMQVTVTYANGKVRDVTRYVRFSTEPLTQEDTEFTILFPYAKYRNTDNADGTSEAGQPVETPQTTITLTVTGGAGRRLGDVNGDGVIDNLDAAMVYAAYNGKGTLSDGQAACADVNGDGVIDNLDASMIYAYYSGRLEKFPAEKGN